MENRIKEYEKYLREQELAEGTIKSYLRYAKRIEEYIQKAGASKQTVLDYKFVVTYMNCYGNLTGLADILGHSNLETTRIYTPYLRQKKNENVWIIWAFKDIIDKGSIMTLLGNSRVILFDEPTNGIDTAGLIELKYDLLRQKEMGE